MATKTPMKDMIVILPGITGSILQKDGKDIWAVSGQAVWQLLTKSKSTIESLTLETGDDINSDIAIDGVRAVGIMQDTHLVPGLVKVDGYTRTARMITDNFEVTKGDIYNDPDDRAANFYEFPYDWRRDNRATARVLKTLIDKRLKCWREKSGAADAKVILMAHSMGGLVSRYYLEVLGGWQDSRALFTFGTPFRGSLNAVNFLANGYKKLFLDLSAAMRSFPSIYQLLPIYQAINIDGSYHRVSETPVPLPNIDQQRAADARKFHQEIEDAVTKNLKDEKYLSSLTVLPIAGVNQPTLQSATLLNGQLTTSEDLPAALKNRTDLGDGDGTVPKVSAIPIEQSSSLKNFFLAEQHGNLQNQPQVLENLLNILRTSQFAELADVRAPETAIGLSLDDLYTPDEEVLLRAKLVGLDGGSLKATIESVSGARAPSHHTFVEQEQGYVLSVEDLPADLYRVTVAAEDTGGPTPSPVHGLFEVVKS
ncbi:lecithin--cholesterol acyltransferase [filamentous cyanobacterium CCP3]|nr:lecithin--cholesterol acyltransferase [filamentous cyanobacterium CCP3]